MSEQLDLPFKPFTLDEVQRITRADPKWVDWWFGNKLPPKEGLGVVGLDDMGCFAVFVGWRYLQEGAPTDRANGVVRYIGSLSLEELQANLGQGLNFPVPRSQMDKMPGEGLMVKAPTGKGSELANKLRLDTLWQEFHQRLDDCFPKVVTG